MDDELQTASVPQNVFEFTRRKRWADVLVSELVGVAILVLSHTGTIIHTDAAVHAVTGYAEDQLIGKNFSDIIHEGDALSFFQAFEDAVAANLELTFYLRIRALDRRDSTIRLVELKANPFREPGTNQCLCVYAMLAPYPSNAVSDLDDFVALKTENEQLVQRIEALRNGNDNWTDGAFESDLGETSSEEGTALHGPSENIVDKSERALAQVSAALGAAAAAAAVANNQGVDGNAAVSSDGPTKKKRRLTESTQGRICTACGRNNSPEWRKGPQGPKTLCNACGLRYAKTISGKGRADTAVAE